MSQYFLMNGEIIDPEEARIPATDLAVLYGMGLFETLRAYGGKVFLLEEHLARMRASAKSLQLPLPDSALPTELQIEGLLEANSLSDARIRITATGGTPTEEGVFHNVFVSAVPVVEYPQEYYERGLTVRVSRHPQPAEGFLAGHKTTCYWPRLQALHRAQMDHCGEVLFFTQAKLLAEGAISNVFVVQDGSVWTPPADTPVLPGITRQVVLKLCQQLLIPTAERSLHIDDVLGAEEIFLTNTMMEILPVCRIERHPVGNEKVGPITRRLMEAYRLRVTGR